MSTLASVDSDFGDFRFGYVAGVNSRDGSSFLVHSKHDVQRFGLRLVEKLPENLDHELHRREIVVVEYDHIALRNRRFLALLLPLLDVGVFLTSGAFGESRHVRTVDDTAPQRSRKDTL
jgi:hypothetical protein